MKNSRIFLYVCMSISFLFLTIQPVKLSATENLPVLEIDCQTQKDEEICKKADDNLSDIEQAKKDEIEKIKELTKDLHPLVQGLISMDENEAKIEKDMHMYKYFFKYISAPWYSMKWGTDLGGKIQEFLSVGLPSILTMIFELIKVFLSVLFLYIVNLTSLSSLSVYFSFVTETIQTYLFGTDGIAFKVIGLVAVLGLILYLGKSIKEISLKEMTTKILSTVVLAIVVGFIGMNSAQVTKTVSDTISTTVTQVFTGKAPTTTRQIKMKEDMFELLIRNPYIMENFDVNGVDIESDDFVKNRLEKILLDDEQAKKDEIDKHKNGLFVNDGAKAWVRLLYSAISFFSTIIMIGILILLIIPVALVGIMFIFRSAALFIELLVVLFKVDFDKLKSIFFNLLSFYLFVFVFLEVVGFIVNLLVSFSIRLSSFHMVVTLIVNLMMFILMILVIKFRDVLLPLLKAYGQSLVNFAKTSSNPNNTTQDILGETAKPIANEIDSFKQGMEQIKNGKNEEAELEHEESGNPFIFGTSSAVAWSKIEGAKQEKDEQLDEDSNDVSEADDETIKSDYPHQKKIKQTKDGNNINDELTDDEIELDILGSFTPKPLQQLDNVTGQKVTTEEIASEKSVQVTKEVPTSTVFDEDWLTSIEDDIGNEE